MALVSKSEPKSIIKFLNDENWVTAIHDKLNILLEMMFVILCLNLMI